MKTRKKPQSSILNSNSNFKENREWIRFILFIFVSVHFLYKVEREKKSPHIQTCK